MPRGQPRAREGRANGRTGLRDYMERIRIYYAKTAPMRYTGNLDVHKVWERTLRRARLPLAYSQGFHPQPRINQACPLPLGMTSQVELIDIWLEEDLPLEQVEAALERAVPPGIEPNRMEVVDLRAPSLQTQVKAADYTATLLENVSEDELRQRVEQLLGAEQILRERRGKTYDLRPLVEELSVQSQPNQRSRLHMRLSAREGATGRAEEVLEALGIPANDARVERTELYFQE